VILPLSRPDLFAHSAVAARPSGVLLYGPPGTGKTLLAKAIAKQADASFLAVNVATLQSKYFGETPKLVEALFSLARRRAPCVVFIDEIDGFLGTRHDMDQQHVNVMKTKFMEAWDGLSRAATAAAAAGAWVLVIGATNKPWAVDPAILRRMPRQIYVGMPDAAARAAILRVLLRGERTDAALDVGRVAAATEGYSGSDLKELVRAASMGPIRDALRAERARPPPPPQPATAAAAPPPPAPARAPPRGIRGEDFVVALDVVRPSGQVAAAYKYEQLREGAWKADAGGGARARAGATPKGSSPPGAGADSPEDAAARALMTFGPSAKANTAALADAIQRGFSASA
jgi:SpoVK/Ycf46/Vps4 family AAA+-type ATPase